MRALTREIKDIGDLLGARNQSMPVLILADEVPAEISSHVWWETRFLYDKDAILDLSSCRHGIAEPYAKLRIEERTCFPLTTVAA